MKLIRKKTSKAFNWLVLAVFCMSLVYAIPLPHGIDGQIYDLKTLSPISKSVSISVHDTTTNELIQGKTRGNGFYSVSLNGDDGDTILITVWTEHHMANRTITLERVMHNVNLLINTSMPVEELSTSMVKMRESNSSFERILKSGVLKREQTSEPEHMLAADAYAKKVKELHTLKSTGPRQPPNISGVIFPEEGRKAGKNQISILTNGNRHLGINSAKGNSGITSLVVFDGKINDTLTIKTQENGSHVKSALWKTEIMKAEKIVPVDYDAHADLILVDNGSITDGDERHRKEQSNHFLLLIGLVFVVFCLIIVLLNAALGRTKKGLKKKSKREER